jgi:peptidylprolyl isomerase
VLLTIPPADAYGETGDAQAGIKPTDTLVFVVDIARSYGQRDAAALTATSSAVPSGAPTVTGAPGARPAITIPPKLAPPAVRRVLVLAEGEGPAVTQGSIVVEYEASSWIGKFIASTWQNGIPTLVPVGDASATQTRGLYDDLVGVRLGSRVLLEAPAGSGEDRFQGSVAMVIDLLAQPTTAKQMDAG